jgi:hypothetical protein
MMSRYFEDKMRTEVDSLKISQETYSQISPNKKYSQFGGGGL